MDIVIRVVLRIETKIIAINNNKYNFYTCSPMDIVILVVLRMETKIIAINNNKYGFYTYPPIGGCDLKTAK